MGTLNRAAFETLIDGDMEWLMRQPCSLERDHIEHVLRNAPKAYYNSCRPCVAKDVRIALMLDTQAKENMRIDNLLAAKDAELERLRSISAYVLDQGGKIMMLEDENTRLRAIESRLTEEGVANEVFRLLGEYGDDPTMIARGLLAYARGEGK